MTIRRDAQLSRRRTLLSAALGLAAVAALVIVVRAGAVVTQLGHAAALLPIAVVLEGGVLACETFALWRLYGDQRHTLTLGEMTRVALAGYPSMVLLPAGRSVAEVVRAAVLAKRTSWELATSVAVEMQVIILVAVSVTSLFGTVGAWLCDAGRVLMIATAANGVLTAMIALVTLTVARRTGLGAWIAARFTRANSDSFDELVRNRPPLPLTAFAATLAGRALQLLEIGVLFFAVSGHIEPATALAVEGIHLVGASLGDLIPNQLGASDATFTFAGQTLGLSASGGLAIALLAHATQALWAVIAAVVPLVVMNRRSRLTLRTDPR